MRDKILTVACANRNDFNLIITLSLGFNFFSIIQHRIKKRRKKHFTSIAGYLAKYSARKCVKTMQQQECKTFHKHRIKTDIIRYFS